MNNSTAPSFSVIIETENLQTADTGRVFACLASLAQQDWDIRLAEQVILITSGDVPASMLAELQQTHPWLTVHQAPEGIDYYATKNLGAQLANSEYVVFADSDCEYTKGWLRNLITEAQRHDNAVITGQTAIAPRNVYSMAMALMYVFAPPLAGDGAFEGQKYQMNNVIFRRGLLLSDPIPAAKEMYRGQCALHSDQLRAKGIPILIMPDAMAWHPNPQGLRNFCQRFVLMGSEAITYSSISKASTSKPANSLLSCILVIGGKGYTAIRRAMTYIRRRPTDLGKLLCALPTISFAMLLFTAGAVWESLRPGAAHARFGEEAS